MLKITCKPKFKIGDYVYFVRHINVPKSCTEHFYKRETPELDLYGVLYGVVVGIRYDYDTFRYSVRLEHSKNLSSEAEKYLCYLERQEDSLRPIIIVEPESTECIFSSDELDTARQFATDKQRTYVVKKQEKIETQILQDRLFNRDRYLQFLIREAVDYANFYTVEDIQAVAKTLDTLRCAITIDFDLLDGVSYDLNHHAWYDLLERNSQYFTMALNALQLSEHILADESLSTYLRDKIKTVLGEYSNEDN